MLNDYLKKPKIRNLHGKNARNLAMTIFDREKLSNKYFQAIENIIQT